MTATTGVTRFLTKQEVAEILQVSLRTIEYYMGCGMPYTKVRRSVRIPEDKLMEWLKEDKQITRNKPQ